MPSSVEHSSSHREDGSEIRRGPWTVEEDNLLLQSIISAGEGRWNELAKQAGLKRTGKSCRLRWLNYLKPDIKRGNISPQEQLLILDLHSRWGNRWSRIAQFLPGRTDNEIKNYWRTRVQRQARQLKIEPNSEAFREFVWRFLMPGLIQKIKQSSSASDSAMRFTAPPGTESNFCQTTNQLNQRLISPACSISESQDIRPLGFSKDEGSQNCTEKTAYQIGDMMGPDATELSDGIFASDDHDHDHGCSFIENQFYDELWSF